MAQAEETLRALRAEAATGPDLVPTRVLQGCSKELALPLHKVATKALHSGRWPKAWLEHWILPLYKKKAVWAPGNYRGVHLTSQVGKAAERLLRTGFADFFASADCSGENQFAYKPERGARDALAFLTLTWVAGFCQKKRFAVYCSDVSGAFDRVRLERLLEKLRAKGVPEPWVELFASWLRERPAKVAVNGQFSEEMLLMNMVFQGTVLGPDLKPGQRQTQPPVQRSNRIYH